MFAIRLKQVLATDSGCIYVRSLRPTAVNLCQHSNNNSFSRLERSQQKSLFSSSAMSSAPDKKLFTPGPLGTSPTVKSAMLRDLGSRDVEFINLVKTIRSKLVEISGVSASEFTAVPVQGSGTFAIESVFQSTVPRSGEKILVLENGAYGKRLGKTCEVLGHNVHVESFPENEKVSVSQVEKILKGDKSYTTVAMTHCETSSGVINPVEEVGKCVKAYIPSCDFYVDAMSSFGAIPLDFEAGKIDYMVSSANKCLEGVPGFSYVIARLEKLLKCKGVPGFSYVIARLEKLLKCKGYSRSLSLDIYDQYVNLEKTTQFRFTPPTHTMLAFAQALKEFEEEGCVAGRSKRYQANCSLLKEGMREMGFQEFLAPEHKGYIITSYCFPQDPNFNFNDFYMKLNARDQVIYPGKVLNADCFRIGSIGYLFPEDVKHLLQCIREVCAEMNIALPIKQ